MAIVRAFENTSRCMQRLGFVKYLVTECARSDTSNMAFLIDAVIGAATRKVKVKLNADLLHYIEKKTTGAAYKELRKTLSKFGETEKFDNFVTVELQDVYLSSSELPSHTGKLGYGDSKSFPLFLSSLGLMRKGTFSILVRGQLLLKLVPEVEIAAFKEALPDHNPFKLDLKQKLLFLYQFIEHDGEVIQPLYSQALAIGNSFSERQLGDYLPEILRELEKKARPRIRTGDDRVRLQRLLELASHIDKWKGKKYAQTTVKEFSIRPRLEPFVDLGLLEKNDPFSYEYKLTEVGKTFMSKFVTSGDIDEFLVKNFFQTCCTSFRINAEPTMDRQFILSALYESHNSLRSALGYAPITDVALRAGIASLIEKGAYFEIEDAVNILKQWQKECPEIIRFNIDRSGKLTYVKFNGAPASAGGG